jgi:hypothetical protein
MEAARRTEPNNQPNDARQALCGPEGGHPRRVAAFPRIPATATAHGNRPGALRRSVPSKATSPDAANEMRMLSALRRARCGPLPGSPTWTGWGGRPGLPAPGHTGVLLDLGG